MKIKSTRTALVAAAILGLVAIGTTPVLADDEAQSNTVTIPVNVTGIGTISDAQKLAEQIRIKVCVVAPDATSAPSAPDDTCKSVEPQEGASFSGSTLPLSFFYNELNEGVSAKLAVFVSNKSSSDLGLSASAAAGVLRDATAGGSVTAVDYTLPALGTAVEGGKVGDGKSKVAINFTLTNVPSKFTKADKLRDLLKVSVYSLAADASSTPADPASLAANTPKKTYEESSKGSLLNGIYSGTVRLSVPKSDSGLTTQNYGVYLTLRSKSESGVAAQTSVGQFVTISKDATTGVWTVTAGLDGLTLDFGANTGSIANPSVLGIDLGAVGGDWAVLITKTESSGKVKTVAMITVPAGATSVALPSNLEKGTYNAQLIQLNGSGSFSLDKAKNLSSPLSLSYVAPN